MVSRLSFFLAIVSFTVACGCGSSGSQISAEKAKALLEEKPVKVEAEQVVLTPQQVECGEKEDLWNPVQQSSGERSVARLNQKAKDLNFDDEVTVHEPGYEKPYTQIRGQVPLQVAEVVNVHDEPDGASVAELKAGVVIPHACFSGSPLPLMGVKRGKFRQDVNPRFQFRNESGEWRFEKILH